MHVSIVEVLRCWAIQQNCCITVISAGLTDDSQKSEAQIAENKQKTLVRALREERRAHKLKFREASDTSSSTESESSDTFDDSDDDDNHDASTAEQHSTSQQISHKKTNLKLPPITGSLRSNANSQLGGGIDLDESDNNDYVVTKPPATTRNKLVVVTTRKPTTTTTEAIEIEEDTEAPVDYLVSTTRKRIVTQERTTRKPTTTTTTTTTEAEEDAEAPTDYLPATTTERPRSASVTQQRVVVTSQQTVVSKKEVERTNESELASLSSKETNANRQFGEIDLDEDKEQKSKISQKKNDVIIE